MASLEYPYMLVNRISMEIIFETNFPCKFLYISCTFLWLQEPHHGRLVNKGSVPILLMFHIRTDIRRLVENCLSAPWSIVCFACGKQFLILVAIQILPLSIWIMIRYVLQDSHIWFRTSAWAIRKILILLLWDRNVIRANFLSDSEFCKFWNAAFSSFSVSKASNWFLVGVVITPVPDVWVFTLFDFFPLPALDVGVKISSVFSMLWTEWFFWRHLLPVFNHKPFSSSFGWLVIGHWHLIWL